MTDIQAKRSEAYKKYQAGLDILLMPVLPEDRDLWVQRRCRFLTLTERAGTEWSEEHYTVAKHRVRNEWTMVYIRNWLRERRLPFIRFWQRELQGPNADWRLHVHLFALDLPVWSGARKGVDGEPGETMTAWLLRMRVGRDLGDEGCAMAMDLWDLGWGMTDCRPVQNARELGEYLSKEITTSDVPGGRELSPEELDEYLCDEFTGRRVRLYDYSWPWRAMPENVWYDRVPLWRHADGDPDLPGDIPWEDAPESLLEYATLRRLTQAKLFEELRDVVDHDLLADIKRQMDVVGEAGLAGPHLRVLETHGRASV